MSTVAHPTARGYRTLRLPLAAADYERFLSDGELAKAQLDQRYGQPPELFPEGWEHGDGCYGYTEASRQQGWRCRRVRRRASGEGFTVAPALMMPSRTAPLAEVEKAGLLMRFQVPCWALAYVVGRDARSWYRLQQGLGRCRVVGPTVKAPGHLPQDLVAEEKPSRLAAEKLYLAMPAGAGCMLGGRG